MTILLLWLWWTEQNNFREEGRRRSTTEVAYITAAMADRVQASKTVLLLPESRQASRWRRPDLGVLKVNSDGAFDSKTGIGGWGFIIQNDEGALVKAGAQ